VAGGRSALRVLASAAGCALRAVSAGLVAVE
jgi:hypothetical protein